MHACVLSNVYILENILTLHFPLTNGIMLSFRSNLSYQCHTDVLYLNTNTYLTYFIVQLILVTNLDDQFAKCGPLDAILLLCCLKMINVQL